MYRKQILPDKRTNYVAVLLCGGVALWRRGGVAMWRCGGVAGICHCTSPDTPLDTP